MSLPVIFKVFFPFFLSKNVSRHENKTAAASKQQQKRVRTVEKED